VFLHGAEERGNDLKLATSQGLPRMLKDRDDFPFITVVPQCSEGEYWIHSMVDELIVMVSEKFRIDRDRMYLTGISMGGYGTWMTAIDFPNFAAIALSAAGDAGKAALATASAGWAFHGAKDP
jgi:predicted peptidase